MKYFTLLRANIKSQRGSFIGILTLVFIITISLLAVLSIWMNAKAYENEQIERVGYGDITYWIDAVDDREALLADIADVAGVERAEAQDVIIFGEYEVYGESGTPSASPPGSFHMMSWTKDSAYRTFHESLTKIRDEAELSDGEIYVSPAFSSIYHSRIGDRVGVRITESGEIQYFTIKGYFEDPVAGSALMGIKQALITENDMQKLQEMIRAAETEALARAASAVHITKKADEDVTLAGLQKLLGEETKLLQIPGFSYSKAAITGFMLILQNMFTGFLILFVLVLMVVAMIIVGHSISSSIEQDYVDMGILKAVGYTRMDLRAVQLLQYAAAVLCGMLPGIPVSVAVVKGIGRLTVTVVGLLIPADIPVRASVLSLGSIMAIIMGFVFVKTAKIGKITPIRAIRGGADDIYFKSRLCVPIRKRGLSFWLACRQLISGKKQYLSACLITALLVFFLSLTVRLDAWLGPDGKGLVDAFRGASFDIGIRYEEEGIREEVERTLESDAHITGFYQYKMERGFLNRTEYTMNVVSAPEYYHILEGRTCLYQNEMILTQMAAEELGVGIGDSVDLGVGGKEQEFIISGIYQCANDTGANFGISKEGYESFGSVDKNGLSYYMVYLLADASGREALIETLEETYGERITVDDNTWSGTDAIVLTVSVLMLFMLLVTIVFILVTVSMTGSKILYKEQRDLGIYKSLGFPSEKLRLAFALRFGMAAVLGSAVGIILSMYLTDPLANIILKICGISHFSSDLSLFRMLSSAIVVCGLFLVFAYFAAGKVKKVEPGILIVE